MLIRGQYRPSEVVTPNAGESSDHGQPILPAGGHGKAFVCAFSICTVLSRCTMRNSCWRRELRETSWEKDC